MRNLRSNRTRGERFLNAGLGYLSGNRAKEIYEVSGV